MSDDPSSKKPAMAHKQYPVSLLDQLSPDYGYDENGLWNGMTKEQVTVAMAKRRLELERKQLLQRWTPPSSPAN